MNTLETLLKAIILLISEYSIYKKIKSIGLVKELLEEINNNKVKAKTFNDDDLLIDKLKTLLNRMVLEEVTSDEDLLVTIEMLLSTKPNLYKILDKYTKRKSESVITNLKRDLNNTVSKIKVKKLLQVTLNRTMSNNSDLNIVLADLYVYLKKNKSNKTHIEDESVVDKVDFSNKESVKKAAQKAADLIVGNTVFKTGWSALNTMCQGGFSRGENISIGALPHRYKSSFLKSTFLQIIRLNDPVIKEGTKPMMLFITLEEEINNIMLFFYVYLKLVLEGKQLSKKEQKNLDANDIGEYVQGVFDSCGFHIELVRVRPDKFNKDSFENMIERYKELGYEIQGIFLDYAKKMSRKGLERGGPSGTDLLELYSILRNITSSQDILFVNPMQLSTRAKSLLDNGLPDNEFTDYIADRAMYADSQQLAQELDLELFVHIYKRKGKNSVVTITRGKHRKFNTISEEDKHFEMEFINPFIPIPEDCDFFPTCILPKNKENDDDEFEF